MSKWDKLLAKIVSLSNDMRFSELQKVLNLMVTERKLPVAAVAITLLERKAANQ